MAIIQSILVGKGKGKIGNVVLSGLKGQTVAKQLNSSPSNPRTVAQTANRVKMANAVLAWQFLANFMSNAKGLRKPLESVYNAFIRSVVNNMESALAVSRGQAAVSALGLSEIHGNWFNLSIGIVESGSLGITLINSGFAWSNTMRICGIVFNPYTNTQVVSDVPVTADNFDNGEIYLTIAPGFEGSYGAAYIYDSSGSKITNIATLIP